MRNKIAKRYSSRDRSSSLEFDAVESFKSKYERNKFATEMLTGEDASDRKVARHMIRRKSQQNQRWTEKHPSIFRKKECRRHVLLYPLLFSSSFDRIVESLEQHPPTLCLMSKFCRTHWEIEVRGV